MKQQIILITFLTVISLTGCNNNMVLSQSEPDKCIPPLESFVYSAYPDPEEEREQIPPNWKIEREINNTLLMSRKIDREVELWFVDAPKPNQSFWVYKPDSKQEWRVSGEIENSGIFVNEIYADSNGAVWGLTNYEFIEENEDNQKVPLLSKLNEDTLTFEFIDETKTIPYTVHGDDPSNSWYWASMIIDHDNMIWFLVPNDDIYVYNPFKNTLEKKISIEELIPYKLSLAPNGDIYFTEATILMEKAVTTSSSDIRVFRVDVQNQQFEQIPVRLDPWPPYGRVFVDHKGEIWLDALGYINEEGRLYQLEKPSIFLVPAFFSGMDYRWSTPEILMESSDGRLWFRSLNGIAWLDLDEQQWCWLTTSSFNVIEDADHNLWMSAYGKLYRKQIKPEF